MNEYEVIELKVFVKYHGLKTRHQIILFLCFYLLSSHQLVKFLVIAQVTYRALGFRQRVALWCLR